MLSVVNKIEFPKYTGIKCNMMPFIQGDSNSLPLQFLPYSYIIENNYLQKGEVGYLTIEESFVYGNNSQRSYNAQGFGRNVHIEVGRHHMNNGNITMNLWGNGIGNTWGSRANVILDDGVEILIANSISDTCRVWDATEKRLTPDGDLCEYINDYPENTGILLKSGELAKINIFTPHECVNQLVNSNRQFFRIVGKGVHGREKYFTKNIRMESILN